LDALGSHLIERRLTPLQVSIAMVSSLAALATTTLRLDTSIGTAAYDIRILVCIAGPLLSLLHSSLWPFSISTPAAVAPG
jgi:hypothetical protein